jgi:hypothetical protein
MQSGMGAAVVFLSARQNHAAVLASPEQIGTLGTRSHEHQRANHVRPR